MISFRFRQVTMQLYPTVRPTERLTHRTVTLTLLPTAKLVAPFVSLKQQTSSKSRERPKQETDGPGGAARQRDTQLY